MTEILVDDAYLSGAPYAAVRDMHKHLAKNRWSLCAKGVIPTHKQTLPSLVKTLIHKNSNKKLMHNTHSTHIDPLYQVAQKSAQEFQAESSKQHESNTWSGSGIMHGLFAAKQATKKNWKTKVQKGKVRRESIRMETAKAADDGVQFGMHRPSSMKDLRYQGNLSMYSDAALLQREGLREHPAILECVDRW